MIDVKRVSPETVRVECWRCHKSAVIPFTEEQVAEVVVQDRLIQHVAPKLSNDQREMLISGTCGACLDKMTSEY